MTNTDHTSNSSSMSFLGTYDDRNDKCAYQGNERVGRDVDVPCLQHAVGVHDLHDIVQQPDDEQPGHDVLPALPFGGLAVTELYQANGSEQQDKNH